jgi:hypothetical protein
MSLTSSLRGFRAITTILVAAALTFAPAAAHASSTSKATAHAVAAAKKGSAAKKEANGKQAATRKAAAGALGTTVGLSAATQLAAMNTALKAAPAFYAGRDSGCALITPLLASQPGATLGGNFRDAAGYCYVWLNLGRSDLLTGSEICKLTLHEIGHLDGLEHSADPADIMYAPFNPKPIPSVCAPGA